MTFDYEGSDWYIPPMLRVIIVIYLALIVFTLQPNTNMNDFGYWVIDHKNFLFLLFALSGGIAIMEIIESIRQEQRP